MGRLRPTLILGGPGCGKTTALLEIVEKAIESGVKPDRIAFVAFTRKAAQEARSRMMEKFSVTKDEIPHFRTLHSFAFKNLDIEHANILDNFKMQEYAKAEGLTLSSDFIDEFGVRGSQTFTQDELALNAYSLARLTCRDLMDVAIEAGLDYQLVDEICSKYEAYKEDAYLVDFTDMIYLFSRATNIPQFDLLIVDEAQDLSALQWKMVDRLVENSKDIYFAGDDDQAIYTWAGADVEHFLSLDADRRVLPVSYRLKTHVFEACQRVIAHCDNRYPKDWKPHAEGGSVDYVDRLENLDLSEGTWFLLARTNAMVKKFIAHLQHEGYPYLTPTRDGMSSSVAVPQVKAVLAYENLKKGKKFSGTDLRLVWDFIKPKYLPDKAPNFENFELAGIEELCCTGFDARLKWYDALTMSESIKSYIRAVKARGESLTAKPRITASTIHGVKGGQAQNVVVYQKLSGLNWKNWIEDSEQEIRALFTAMSRAEDRLVFLSTRSRKNYSIERILL